MKPLRFALIPGAGADPRVYGMTIAALEELGHEALAPDLPLDDEAATPSDHARAVVEALPDDGIDLVVVGQSLGAYAAPLAAHRAGASALILIAPMIPAPGETAGEWGENVGHEAAIADLGERLGEPSEWDGDAVAEVFLHDVPADVIEANAQYDGAPVPGLFSEPWPLDAWPAIPTRVIAPREDRLFPLDFQRRVTRERLGIEVDEIDGGHLPYLSRPESLARFLGTLAEATRP
jgi:hypothetical protein